MYFQERILDMLDILSWLRSSIHTSFKYTEIRKFSVTIVNSHQSACGMGVASKDTNKISL